MSNSDSTENDEGKTSRDVFVVLNAAVSLDGFIDDCSDNRLMLSNDLDWDAVDELRAWSDAILVGANTIRKDNPQLLIRSNTRQEARLTNYRPCQPTKITLTRSGVLDSDANFFTTGTSAKIVFCPATMAAELKARLSSQADVICLDSESATARDILRELARRGINRLLVEGGSVISTMFLTAGLVNEFRIAIVPFFVGQSMAPRLTLPGEFPYIRANSMKLKNVEQLQDVVALTYELVRSDY